MMKIKHKGFTLLELVMTIVISSIVAGSATGLLSKGLNAFFVGRNSIDADWQGRLALERMSREIRNIRSSSDISKASSSEIDFVDNTGTQVSFYLSGSQLMRKSPFTATGQVLADGIASLTFTYYDVTNTPTAVTSNIRYITVVANITYGGTNFNLTTGIYPWNLH